MDEDPRLWFSDELNRFMKHERKIGRKDATVLTNKVFERLYPEDQARWKKWRNASAEIPWDLYTDGDTDQLFDQTVLDEETSHIIATWRPLARAFELTEGKGLTCST
ncbi:MAG: hypothetical protein HYU41_12470 [Candidatus Rokubacteria bacterium]|nr:hypothetical protein [Candidatus Rokubacteria bacterium]